MIEAPSFIPMWSVDVGAERTEDPTLVEDAGDVGVGTEHDSGELRCDFYFPR